MIRDVRCVCWLCAAEDRADSGSDRSTAPGLREARRGALDPQRAH